LKIPRAELFWYLLLILLTFTLTSISVITFNRPNFTDPFNPEFQPPKLPNINVGPQRNPDLSWLSSLFYIVVIGAILFSIYFIYTQIKLYNDGRARPESNRRDLNVKEARLHLEDARTRAYEIIEQGLLTGNYTEAYINAYIALDESLDNFREFKRPKHFTPKEYAFTVQAPVFSPSVFRFVSSYYDIRYGMSEATKAQLLEFKQSLDYLFIEDVPESIAAEWRAAFQSYLTSAEQLSFRGYIDRSQEVYK